MRWTCAEFVGCGVRQDLTADQPNTRWCGDIIYVQTAEGWVCTATVIDLRSREIIDCAINNVRRSRGRRGACTDNAVSGSFFATCKKELTMLARGAI